MFNQWLRPRLYPALGYALSVVLVVVYVNMFPLWKFLSMSWKREVFVFLPIIMSIGAITIFGVIFIHRKQSARFSVKNVPLVIGILFCCLALIIPDPQFPVKRIHVIEYMLLSLVVRFAMSFSVQGLPLLFFSAAFAAVLGIHDELLQGFHLSRTYGLRDIAVNTLASFGGAAVWHQLRFFSRKVPLSVRKAETSDSRSFLYVFCLIASVLAFIFPLVLYRGGRLPFWPVMPLIGTIVYFILYYDRFVTSWKHGVGALSFASFALIGYPVVNGGKAFIFY